MRKILRVAVCVFFVTFFSKNVQAQMSGIYNVPSNFSTIAAAISSLNAVGVIGPVTINVNAGHVEAAPVGGFSLTATGTSANPIIFQKSGAGANPLITAYSGGVGTPATALQDGVWRLIGSDYITIDGIDIIDPNVSNPATMEFGYGLFKADQANGCQNNTIQNCVITLNKNNNAAGGTLAVDGSRGIDVVNALSGAHITVVTVTVTTGSNSNNKFYGNTIQNCNTGIALIGFAAASPFTLADTGNDIGGTSSVTGNTIVNFGGGGAPTANPSAAIRTLAQYNINVSFNTINNNNGSGVNHTSTLRGIYLNTAISANATINNNILTIKGGTTTTQISVIENVSGATAANNTISINNNLITNCTNSLATTGIFNGLYNTASAAYLNISNNTFTNNTSNATSGAIYLIRNTGAVTTQININANNFSHSLTGAAAHTGALYNISNTGGNIAGTLSVSNNNFSNYNHVNATGTGSIICINNSGDFSNTTFTSNNFSNVTLNSSGAHNFIVNTGSTHTLLTVTSNSVTNYTRTAASGGFYGYYAAATTTGIATHVVSNNVFSNISSTLTGTGVFYGLYNTEGNTSPYPKKSVFNNTLSNINYNGTGTFYGIYTTDLGDGGTTTGSEIYNNLLNNITFGDIMYGLYSNTPVSPNYMASVYSNTVSNMTSNAATSAALYASYLGSSLAGINFRNNKIYDITANGPTGVAYGLYAITSTTSNIYNNLIGNIYAPFSTGANKANGIYVASGTNINIYYNSVYLNGTSTGADFSSNAIYAATGASNVTLRNNIFVNTSVPTGTGVTAAYRRSSITLTSYGAASNNNLFYAGTPSPNTVIYTDGTTVNQTLGGYKTTVTPRDAISVTENPPFVTTVGSNANFLNLSTSISTQAESGAGAIAGITTDYAGTVRNATTPDIGAWEGNFIFAGDVSAPAFLASGFTSSACNFTSRTFTVNITDATGVDGGALSPRVYYQVNATPYTSTQATLTSGTALNGVWTFSMSYSAALNDVITYYIVAQDIAATANLGASPQAGFSGIDVNTVTTPPTTPNTYTISSVLSGTYTVGAAGNFTTLTSAAIAYNTSCLAGPVTFVLIDPSYSAAETFPVIFLENPDASTTNSLLIIPAANTNVVITGTTTASSTLKFLNARYITVDGLNSGGSSLSVENPNTGTHAVLWLASSSAVGPGNNNITFRRLNITGGISTGTGKYGILAGQDAANPVTTTGIDNDNITIQNNTILNTYYGIYASGTATVSTGGLDNWNISNNNIGPVTSGTNHIGFRGVFVSNAPGIAITNNTIRNIFPGASGASGIYLSAGINGGTVSQNTITNLSSTVAASGTGALNGIYVGSNVVNTTVNSNQIYDVVNSTSTGYAGRGIIINTANAASNDMIYNNMISGIMGTGDASAIYWPIGIAVEGSSGGINIYNNSVNMAGTYLGVSTATASAAMYLNSTGPNINIRNNILSNTYDNSTITTDVAYGVYSSAATATNLTMDYNDYYVSGTSNIPVLGYISSAQQLNIPAIQASFGGNVNSQNILPVFTSINDLHLIPLSNSPLDNLGTPIAGVTIDIDGQTRNITTPDIGADEFTSPNCTTANGGTLTNTSYALCAGQTAALTSTNASQGATTIYQWQVSNTPGGPYTNVTGGTGALTTSYITGTLTAGTYYYVLNTTCTVAALSAISNEATVTVNSIPTATASSNAPICAGQALNLTAGTDIGTNFNWSGPNAFSSTTQNPVIAAATTSAAGVYTLIVSAINCSATPVTTTVTINSTNLSILASPPQVCFGNSATLTAVGNATSVTWSSGPTTTTNVVSPTSTTVYSVTGTSTTGCVGTAVFTMVVTNPTISAINALVCNVPGTGTLSVNAFSPSVVNWYQTPTSTVSLATGTNYVVTAPTNTTVYAEASSGMAGAGTLTTGVTGTSSFIGEMFDIVAVNSIEVTGFDVHLAAGTGTYEVWYRPGTHVGFSTSNVGWTLASTTTLVSNGNGTFTPVTNNISVIIPAGQTYGFYIVANTGPNVRYNPGTALGNIVAQNSDLQLLEGTTGNTYFNCATSPRAFNGKVIYNTFGCTSPRIPVTLTVSPTPTVTVASSASIICVGQTATLTASGAATYSWNTTSTSTVITVSPSVNTSYTVTGTTNGCSNTAIITQSVSTCTGVDANLAFSNLIKVYPNPSNGVIIADFNFEGEKEVVVTNSVGQIITTIKTKNTSEVIDLNKYAKGIYFVKVMSNTNSANYRIVIQ